jgi:hypothetical protein
MYSTGKGKASNIQVLYRQMYPEQRKKRKEKQKATQRRMPQSFPFEIAAQ